MEVVVDGLELSVFHYLFGEVNDGFLDDGISFGGEGGRFGGVAVGVEGFLGGELEEVNFVGDIVRVFGGRIGGFGWFEGSNQFAIVSSN